MHEKNKVAKVATPKVIEKTAKAWGALSTAERAELKAKLPLTELYVAIVSRGFDMIDYIVRTNDEAAKSAIDDHRAALKFYEGQLNIEETEDRRSYLYAKIDETNVALTSTYNQHRKDRLKIIYAVTAGVSAVGIFAVGIFAKNGKIPR